MYDYALGFGQPLSMKSVGTRSIFNKHVLRHFLSGRRSKQLVDLLRGFFFVIGPSPPGMVDQPVSIPHNLELDSIDCRFILGRMMVRNYAAYTLRTVRT